MNKNWIVALLMLVLCSCSNTANKKQVQIEPSAELNEIIENGKRVYRSRCASCHQRNAKGIPNLYPPLINTKTIRGDESTLINIVLNGMKGKIKVDGEKYDGLMPGFKNLSDKDIADVLNYLRNGFGDNAELINENDVKQSR